VNLPRFDPWAVLARDAGVRGAPKPANSPKQKPEACEGLGGLGGLGGGHAAASNPDALANLGLGGLTIAEHCAQWSRPAPAALCEACGEPGGLVPFGIGPWSWLHVECWPEWFANRKKCGPVRAGQAQFR
jgi:hypothetical protein